MTVVPRGDAIEWLRFVSNHQNADGSWTPLWFGNQDHPQEENPVYGTAKVLMAYRDLALMVSPEARRGLAWLVANQNEDGGWGSGAWHRLQIADCKSQTDNLQLPITNLQSSIEETALAIEALLAACPDVPCPLSPVPSAAATSAARGLAWLTERVEADQHRQPAPIGLYFAKLWYYERLYPLIFTTAALGRACRQFALAHQATAAFDAP
jgi:squalene-hopene/tetraprenyl-beta-curcumene cyclase